jgi:hypothetical protein
MPTYSELYAMCKRLSDEIDTLEIELARERERSAEYLANWISAQDTASYRNMLLMCAGK